MPMTGSLSRPLTGSLTGSLANVGLDAGGYLVETLDYFTRAEALGGSFDLTGTDALYTESYVKSATDAMVRAAKGQTGTLLGTYGGTVSDVWSKLTEVYPLAGVTFAGIPAKLKYDQSGVGIDYTSDFTVGVDGWSTLNSSLDGNIDGIGGQDDNLRITPDTSGFGHGASRTGVTSGTSYRVSCDVYIPSTNTLVDGVQITQNGGSGTTNYESITQDAWVSISGELTPGNQIRIRALDGSSDTFTGNGTDVFYVRNITITNLGAQSLTNNNFVAGDLVPAGSGAGLVGDASSKRLTTPDLGVSVSDNGAFAYLTEAPVTTGSRTWVSFGSGYLGRASGGAVDAWRNDTTALNYAESNASLRNGFFVGTSRSLTDRELYRNGGSLDENTNSTSTPSGQVMIFGESTTYSDPRMSIAGITTGLTDDEAAYLSWVVNGWATLMGFNTYANP